MDTLQALVIAVLTGATELFPLSSPGHAAVVSALVERLTDQEASDFLPFVVTLHLGTAAALLAFFWRDWATIAVGALGIGPVERVQSMRRFLLLITIATAPVVTVGFTLEQNLQRLFGAPTVAAAFLSINGGLLILGEHLHVRISGFRTLRSMTVFDAVAVGLCACMSVFPGISRSGATMVGGLLCGFDHVDSARFSFLVSTPIIVGATVLEASSLLVTPIAEGTIRLSMAIAVVSAVTAFASAAFLMRYFRDHGQSALNPFGWYCLLAGLASMALLTAR